MPCGQYDFKVHCAVNVSFSVHYSVHILTAAVLSECCQGETERFRFTQCPLFGQCTFWCPLWSEYGFMLVVQTYTMSTVSGQHVLISAWPMCRFFFG